MMKERDKKSMYVLKNQKKTIRIVTRIKQLRRRRKKERALPGDVSERFVSTPAGRVRTLCFGFEKPSPEPVFFDLHGGGFVMGTAETDIPFCRYLHESCRCKVVSIEYSKAPEHPYLQAVNEVYEVVRHFTAHAQEYGIDPARMCIGGHSAGGNLAAVTALRSLKEKDFSFLGQILDYPPMDLSINPHDKPSPKGAIPARVAEIFDACYLPDTQHEECPYVSPVYSKKEDMAGLPPALVIVAGHDSLHDEAVRYYHQLRDAQVPARLVEYPDAKHGFTLQDSPDAADAHRNMAQFLKERFAAR